MDSHEDTMVQVNMGESCSDPEDSPPADPDSPSIKFPRLSGDRSYECDSDAGSSIVVAQSQADVTFEMFPTHGPIFNPTQNALQPQSPSVSCASEHLAEEYLSTLALSEEDIDAFRRADATGRVKVKILLQLPEVEKRRHIKAVKHDLTEFYLALNTLLSFGEHNRITLTKLFKKHRKDMGGCQDCTHLIPSQRMPLLCHYRYTHNELAGQVEETPEIRALLQDCGFWTEDQADVDHLMEVPATPENQNRIRPGQRKKGKV